MMSKVPGTGCMLTAILRYCAANPGNHLTSQHRSCTGISGEIYGKLIKPGRSVFISYLPYRRDKQNSRRSTKRGYEN